MREPFPDPARVGAGPPPPPETIDDPALTAQAASQLMARLGFIVFRTCPGSSMFDSCLMAIIRNAPTFRHFDPELLTYWVFADGHGRLEAMDHTARVPSSRAFSWGRIRLIDRLGKRNSFVSFGGQLTVQAVGRDVLLAIFCSTAPILRLPGHSQREDRLADEAVAFFGRLVPRLWSADRTERRVGTAAPEVLHAAFLLYARARTTSSNGVREMVDASRWRINRDLDILRRERPGAVAAGRRLLVDLGLDESNDGGLARYHAPVAIFR